MDINSHILSSFNDNLESIRKRLIEMVNVVEGSIISSKDALIDGDLDLSNRVIADDDYIDNEERVIDDLAINTLLRYNPVASDLRFVVSSLSIAKNLERIGDHASQIAKNTRKIYKKSVMKPDLDYINDLFTLALEQFQHAKHAIINTNTKSAEKCLEGEENMRKITKKISKIFVRIMGNDSDEVTTYLSLVMIARSVERISKLSCNIAEDIIYIETAENLRGQDATPPTNEE